MREVVKPKRRHFGEARLLRRREARATGKNDVGFIDKDWGDEPELTDAGDERAHLFVGVRSGGTALGGPGVRATGVRCIWATPRP